MVHELYIPILSTDMQSYRWRRWWKWETLLDILIDFIFSSLSLLLTAITHSYASLTPVFIPSWR